MKTPREFAYQVTAVALFSVAAVLLVVGTLTSGLVVFVICAMPFVVVGVMFAAEFRRLRRGAPARSTTAPRAPGVDTGGAQTHGAAGGFFGGV